jgi:hypothetical protein
VPNDGSGRGLKASIDAWLANQPPASQKNTHPFPCKPPPHSTLSFETLSPTHQPEAMSEAHIVEVAEVVTQEELDEDPDSPPDIFKVLAMEKKKQEAKALTMPEFSSTSAPPAPSTAAPASNPPRTGPQFRYHPSAEDQQLTAKLMAWLLSGKLTQTTPTHILTTSPSIRKDMVEKLRTCRIEGNSLEEMSYLDSSFSLSEHPA